MIAGQGCQGTCIKDTWTRPKGVGLGGAGMAGAGGEWWGENRVNCIWTRIKRINAID